MAASEPNPPGPPQPDTSATYVPKSGDPHALSPLPPTHGGSQRTPSHHSHAVPDQDLTQDKLLLAATRMEYNARKVPCLGGIALLAKLGQGGMGAVYLGVHPRLEQQVAVKVLPFTLAEQQPQLVDRFLREARIAARIKSPHLVGVQDVNQENGLFYLVMEFVPGDSAGGLLRKLVTDGHKGLSEAMALDICIAATEGLSVAHQEGVIHRDIKPDNIMIPRSRHDGQLQYMQAKLSDLGLARDDEAGLSLTGAQAALGTPGYMSPEQAMDAKKCGKPADVFSMGATLHALLTAHPAFGGSSPMEIIFATIQKPPMPVSQFRQDVTPATQQLIERCLAKEPEKRFADGNLLLRAMKACRMGVGDVAATQRGPNATAAAPAPFTSTMVNAATAPAAAPQFASSSVINTPQIPLSQLTPAQQKSQTKLVVALVVVLILLAVAGGALAMVLLRDKNPKSDTPAVVVNDEPKTPVTPPAPPPGPVTPPAPPLGPPKLPKLMPPAELKEKIAVNERAKMMVAFGMADQLLQDKKFSEARGAFQTARESAVFDEDIKRADKGMASAEKGISDERYTRAILEGDVAMKNQVYDDAIKSYRAALKERNDSNDAMQRLETAIMRKNEKPAVTVVERKDPPPVERKTPPDNEVKIATPVETAEDRYTRAMADARASALRVPRVRFGVAVSAVDDNVRTRYNLANATGAVVTSVVPGSPAAKAGLKQGHCIVALGNSTVATPQDFLQAVKTIPQGRAVAIVYSEKEKVRLNVDIGPPISDAELMRKWNDAEDAYRRALREKPNDATASAELIGALNNGGKEAYDAGQFALALNAWMKAAGLGDAAAQYAVGTMHLNGTGTLKDPREAAKWYQKAANLGLASAQYDLGCMYMSGLGVAQNDQEAVRLYQLAANQNMPIAQNNLGIMYLYGRGVVLNRQEARKWIKKAADQGEPLAKKNLEQFFNE